MKWNEIFKLMGPLSTSIRQNPNGYSFVLKERTIFQFQNFSFECISVDLSKEYMDLIGENTIKRVFKEDWNSMRFFTL